MDAFEKNHVETPAKGMILLECGFRTNGGSAPTVFYGKGIKSISRSGAGELVVTLQDEYKGMSLMGRGCHLSMAVATNSFAQLGAYVANAGTLAVHTLTGGAAADIASAVDNVVWLRLALAYSTLGGDGTANYDT